MPIIKCPMKDCLHHSGNELCGVTNETVIDLNRDAKCVDYSPVTDAEYLDITGTKRSI